MTTTIFHNHSLLGDDNIDLFELIIMVILLLAVPDLDLV
jgi:hypothetical protein